MITFLKLLTPISKERERTLFKIATLAETQGVSILLFGATARDILFSHMHGIESGRMTMDVDISIQLPDWNAYNKFGEKMRSIGFFNKHEGHEEKFTDEETGQEVDLLPFGEISEDGTKIVWPNDNSVWSVTGFKDALDHAFMLSVCGDSRQRRSIPIIPVPALVMLKIIALNDRPEDRYKKDGADIAFVIKNYLEIGNSARLKEGPHNDIMASVDSDIELASATLIGRDIRGITSSDSSNYLLELLDVDIKSRSRCYLARGIMNELCKGDFKRARGVLSCLRAGLLYE